MACVFKEKRPALVKKGPCMGEGSHFRDYRAQTPRVAGGTVVHRSSDGCLGNSLKQFDKPTITVYIITMSTTLKPNLPQARILRGHTSPETAYVVNDYPYGFRLRCKIRYWLENKAGKGYRRMTQTTNPAKSVTGSGDVWNKPKASTYRGGMAFMFLDAEQHVEWVNLSVNWDDAETFLGFAAKWAGQWNSGEADTFNRLSEISRKVNKTSWAELDAKLALPAPPVTPAMLLTESGEPICCGAPMIKGSNNFVCAKCSRIETFNIAEAAANFTKSSLANPGVGANADENNAPKI
jgi:hypothetical protein